VKRLRSFNINDNTEYVLNFAGEGYWIMYSLILKSEIFIEVLEDAEVVMLSRDQEYYIPKFQSWNFF
jgi:hypothetical protein